MRMSVEEEFKCDDLAIDLLMPRESVLEFLAENCHVLKSGTAKPKIVKVVAGHFCVSEMVAIERLKSIGFYCSMI